MIRLTIYEVRRLLDTRSSAVVLGICLLSATGLGVVGLVARPDGRLDLSQMAAGVVLPFAIIAPILAAITAASDWRTSSIQHTLFVEHRRERVFVAKACAAVAATACMSAVVVGVALLVGLLVGSLRGQPVTAGDVHGMLWGVVALVVPGSAFGFAFGAALLSAPLAITVVLTVELVADVGLSALPGGFGSYLASASFSNWMSTGRDPWAGLTSLVIWIVLPAAVGLGRYVRSEAA
jgi:hypothetical protein